MKVLFALAFLASSSQAGVVMPVENGVAPAGPSAPVVPVLAPAAGSFGSPSWGAALNLGGALPLLPAPVPGLVGPALNFVGSIPEAAALRPETVAAGAAPSSTPAPAKAQLGRAADQTPALPAKHSPGAAGLAISRDRSSAASSPERGASLTRSLDDEAAAHPLVEGSSLEHAPPEKAAGLGRKFFDQSADKDRGTLENAAGSDRSAPVIAATILQGGAFGPGARLTAPNAGAAFGAGHAIAPTYPSFASEGESLHDAVASAPGAVSPGGFSAAAAGPVLFYHAASPNGELAPASGAAVPAVAALPVLGAPRPLALDLSRSGLIVRVRSAWSAVIAPALTASPAPPLSTPGPSTAFLERGAMLEAFSVAGDYAARAAAQTVARPLKGGVSKTAPPAPVSDSSPAPLWWAWFALPLFVAAIRGIL